MGVLHSFLYVLTYDSIDLPTKDLSSSRLSSLFLTKMLELRGMLAFVVYSFLGCDKVGIRTISYPRVCKPCLIEYFF